MKTVTEFPSYVLTKALSAQTALAAEGKSSEEVQTGLGESLKLEGDKLKFLLGALTVASQNTANLRRVLVVSLADGEKAPAKAVQIEEHYYVPEFLVTSMPQKATNGDARGGRRGGKDGGKGGPKSSPWGMSPEEIAAKNKPKQS